MDDTGDQRPPVDDEVALLAGLRELAAYLPRFAEPAFHFGEAPRPRDGHTSVGDHSYSDAVQDFIEAAYRLDVVELGFEWSDWMQTEEARQLRDDPEQLALATPRQLARLLTVVIRQDRFVGGSLMTAYESGLLTGILRRAWALTRSDAPDAAGKSSS